MINSTETMEDIRKQQLELVKQMASVETKVEQMHKALMGGDGNKGILRTFYEMQGAFKLIKTISASSFFIAGLSFLFSIF